MFVTSQLPCFDYPSNTRKAVQITQLFATYFSRRWNLFPVASMLI